MADKAEPTTEGDSAATEHTEATATEHTDEPQLAELVTQEAGFSYEIELKDQSWMLEAAGPKAVAMAEDAATMCGDNADAQRIQLIRNLLQSSSMTKANRPIDEGRFLIGGDMNLLSTFR